ncbi:sodium-coupled monocarboxylate transporter 1-like [Portunus trituberculatus]|uniref:sodium-coupled monocarboxylate transporter 1-like n=1 Tax=Portunus trituberculatus TaxID=210409 RepID=UPI001E1CC889|nr:sodium-coupled monocarboxylate transporter 1-like [Portunus trituberculatus]XP_045135915.1 sodium-coupled monocarboxylate transporter 1-like [Portunus trituberculatus]XP_045135916.1 sodium-coupled monocarboxylate transporter 1-like [Portunus trituberculatus]XP_045135917.1 sodium-coupled monocarboxylate transporter 1-like [Portunus trituberculatus]
MASSGLGVGFSGWDWAVFVVTLMASLGTGAFAGWVARRKTKKSDVKGTAAEFLMGGRELNLFAVALSTMIGALSSISILGNSAEMYAYGTQLCMSLIGTALGAVFVHLVNLRVFYPLKITSVYTYIERRFQSRALTYFIVYSTFVGTFFYVGLCAYTPSLAMETMTGVPAWVSIIIMGVVCTIYSSLGGVRAVVYTDILQVFVMMGGVVTILVTAVVEVGGMGRVFDIAREHGRIELWNVNPDPLQRHSLWLVIMQGYFLVLLVFGMGQPQVQRICSVSTWRKAIGAHYLNIAIFITSMVSFYLLGLSVYAVYADCDPLATGEISKADQLVPFYVSDRLSGYYGLPGLLIASLYAGGLSSYSSQINAVSAVMWEDFFKNSAWVASMKEERRPYVNVLVSAITGTLGVVAGIVSTQVGGVFQAGQTILGTINAPQLGLFLLGMCCPFANKIGGMVGMAASLAFNFWVTLGAMFSGVSAPTLDFSDDGCALSTSPNSSFPPTSPFTESPSTYSTSFVPPTEPPQDPYVFPLYLMSYTMYSFVGVSITVFVGAVTSLLTNPWTTKKAGKIYLHPTFYALQKRWENRRSNTDPPFKSTQDLVSMEKF